MKNNITKILYRFFLLTLFLLLGIQKSNAQQSKWVYEGELSFPQADSIYVKPYASTIDSAGNIWVISSIATDDKAHNSVWKAAPGDKIFTKVIDFGNYNSTDTSANYDENVGILRGIYARGNDIYLSGTLPFAKTKPNTLSFLYVLRNGSISDSLHFGFGMRGGGFGTYIDCITITNDSIAFAGCPYDPSHLGPSFRAFNMSGHTITAYNSSGEPAQRTYGSYLFGDPSFQYSAYYSPAPGGPMDATAYDQIRSIALVPGMNYADSASAKNNSYFYTSRSSSTKNPGSGGIAIWKGGFSKQPAAYTANAITDVSGDLSFGTFTYYGITSDSSGNLFVCRPDSGYEWVKEFVVAGNFATEIGHLPSLTDPNNPDANGAPFKGPTAISLSPDESQAYVVDQLARKVFTFTTKVTDVKQENISQNISFQLEQNYPNPFNPSTVIVYNLSKNSNVTLSVFNSVGQKIKTLVNSFQTAGKHAVNFSALNIPSGIYFYRIEAGSYSATKKMILLK